jgi:hypothetical protein
MAKSTNLVTLSNGDWTEVSALANVMISWAGGGSTQWCVAAALADIDTELTRGHPMSQKSGLLHLTNLGTSKVFVKGASGDQLIVTAYA